MSKKQKGNDFNKGDYNYLVPLCKFDYVIDFDNKEIRNPEKLQKVKSEWDIKFEKLKKIRDDKMKKKPAQTKN